MATMEARVGSLPQPYPSLPASPTLTNPDMILPDYDLASSPGLDEDRQVRSQSPLMMWKNAHAAASGADLQQLFSGVSDHHAFPAGPITPTTPIIYGNGTMLSDIGEVTEVESTPGRPSPSSVRRRGAGNNGGVFGSPSLRSRSRSRSPSPTPLPHNIRHPFQHNHHNAHSSRDNLVDVARQSSPTMGVEEANSSSTSVGGTSTSTGGVKQRARQQQQQQKAAQDRARRDSIDSNSTITTQDHANLFADFDDTVSVGDSVFQGDDEESVAESYVDDGYVAREVPITSTAASSSSALLTVPEFSGGGGSSSGGNTSDEGEQRRLSAASLSLRAEQILANAKKRLTTMEGNLNRARSSLYITSPSAGSLPSDGSTPSPKTPVRSATASSRYHDPSPNSPMHARIGSDGSMPANGIPTSNPFPQRSASALGAAGGYRQPQLASSKSAEQIRDSLSGGYQRASYNKPVDIVLEPLDEIEAPDDESIILPSENRTSTQLETFLSPASSTANDKGLTRSASVAQMRDLKDQMKDLKGKISTLREQARADNLKRRSLQSLRTPSPFTHSQIDQWYAEPQTIQGHQPTSARDSSGRNPWNGELSSVDGDQAHAAGIEMGVDRGFVTPPPQHAVSSGSARLSGSTGSRSSASRSVKQITSTTFGKDQTDQESVNSAYEVNSEIGKVRHSYSGSSRRATESPVLGDARPGSAENLSPSVDDDMDDMHTENGDVSDEDETKPTGVFISSVVVDEADAVNDEDNSVPLGKQAEADDVGGYESESGESLYHDTLQHQLSHEDREDAFDYEHFILHSALGTISQQRLAGHARSGSFSSEDSVETTRGPIATSQAKDTGATSPGLDRRASMASISTVDSTDSFATATEGRTSRTNRLSSGSEKGVADSTRHSTKSRPDSVLLTKSAAASNFSSGAGFTQLNAKRNSAEEPRQTQQPPMVRRPASSAALPGHRPSVSSFESTGTTRSFPLVNRNRIGSIGGATAAASSSKGDSTGSITLPTSGSGNTPEASRSSSDNEELRSISEALMDETASIFEQQQAAAAETGSQTNLLRHRRSLDSQQSLSRLSRHQERPESSASAGAGGMSASHAQALQMLAKEDHYLVERLVANLGRCILGLSESGRASSESRVFRRRIDAARRILEGLDPV